LDIVHNQSLFIVAECWIYSWLFVAVYCAGNS